MAKDLDNELAEAAGIDEDDGSMALPEPPELRVEPPHGRESSAKRGNNNVLLAMLLLMTGGVVLLFMYGFEGASVYSMGVDQFLAEKDKHVDRRVRIEGELVPGTLKHRPQPCEYRFTIKGAKSTLPIRYAQCILPDTFRDVPEGGVEVTAEGVLDEAGHLEADLIMAKCSSKYDKETHTLEGKPQAKAPPAN